MPKTLLTPEQYLAIEREAEYKSEYFQGEMLAMAVPSTTGEPGGKETGQSVTHYIIPGGPYATAYAKLQATGFQLHWESAPEGRQAKAKKASKTKFTCPDCEQNAWAKPDALLICGACYEDGDGDITLMVAEPETAGESRPVPVLSRPARRGPHPA